MSGTTLSLGLNGVVATTATRRNVLYANKPITLDDAAGLNQSDITLAYNQTYEITDVQKVAWVVSSASLELTLTKGAVEMVVTMTGYFLMSADFDAVKIKNVTSGSSIKARVISN